MNLKSRSETVLGDYDAQRVSGFTQFFQTSKIHKESSDTVKCIHYEQGAESLQACQDKGTIPAGQHLFQNKVIAQLGVSV